MTGDRRRWAKADVDGAAAALADGGGGGSSNLSVVGRVRDVCTELGQ